MNNRESIKYGIKSNFLSHISFEKKLGRIHSIFTNSFNIQIGNQLIHVSKISQPLSAFGISIEDGVMDALLKTIKSGDLVKAGKEQFCFYTRAQMWELNWSDFQEMNCHMPEIPAPPSWVLIEIITKLEQYMIPWRAAVIIQKEDEEVLERFLHAQSDDSAYPVIHYFYGRGIGLTPSGDDFLMGYLMMETALGEKNIWKKAVQAVCHDNITTDISQAYYQSLLAGWASSQFIDFFQNLQRQKTQNLDENIKKIMEHGHTSGLDTLFGIYIYLRKYLGMRDEKWKKF